MRLLNDESVEWQCFCCDKQPLMMYHDLCIRLCEYYAKEKQTKKRKMATLKLTKVSLSSDADSVTGSGQRSGQSIGRPEMSDGVTVGGTKGGSVRALSGEGVLQRGGEREGEGGMGKDEGNGKGESGSNGGDKAGKGRRGEGGGDGGGDGSGDKKRPNKKKRKLDTSDSDIDTSSCDEEDDNSPQIDTDDISISDTSLFEGGDTRPNKKKITKKVDPHKDSSPEDTTTAQINPQGDSNEQGTPKGSLSPSSSATGRTKSVKKKMKSVPHGFLSRRAMMSSDSDDDFESFPTKRTPRGQKISSLSPTNSRGGENLEEKEERKRKKRSNLVSILSSGSESDSVTQKLNVQELQDYDEDKQIDSPICSTSLTPKKPIVYATPRKMSVSSSDSDDVSVLERKQKNRVIGSDSDSGCKTPPTVSADVREISSSKAKDTKRKKRVRKRREMSSGDDFDDDGEVRVRGVQLKRRRVARTLLSDSDSNSEDEIDSDEEAGRKEGEEEEEGDDKGTPGRKRKKIRKLFTDAKLQSSTKEAQRAEKERIERLKKRQQALVKGKEDELILEEDAVTKKVTHTHTHTHTQPMHIWYMSTPPSLSLTPASGESETVSSEGY